MEGVRQYPGQLPYIPVSSSLNSIISQKPSERIGKNVKSTVPDTPGSERNGLGLSDKRYDEKFSFRGDFPFGGGGKNFSFRGSGKRSYKFAIFAMICSFVSYYIIWVLFSNCRQSASSSTTVTLAKTFDKRAFWTKMGTYAAMKVTLATTGAWLGVATVACLASVVPICVGALMAATVSATAVILAAGAYIYYLSTADFSSVVKLQ